MQVGPPMVYLPCIGREYSVNFPKLPTHGHRIKNQGWLEISLSHWLSQAATESGNNRVTLRKGSGVSTWQSRNKVLLLWSFDLLIQAAKKLYSSSWDLTSSHGPQGLSTVDSFLFCKHPRWPLSTLSRIQGLSLSPWWLSPFQLLSTKAGLTLCTSVVHPWCLILGWYVGICVARKYVTKEWMNICVQ